MATVCPTVTAYDLSEFKAQLSKLMFAPRLHIDLMDGKLAPTQSPQLSEIKLPVHKTCDIHLMYQRPMEQLQRLETLRPNLVIIHNEAEVHHMHFAAELHRRGIKAGLALLADTPVDWAEQIIHSFDHVLIFSGHLGYHGGQADFRLLDKVRQVRQIHPDAEISWDGGINDQNAEQLVEAGVDILNVGGFIARADEPQKAYDKIKATI